MASIFRFCKYCGRELPQGKELIVFCPHCGKRLSALPTEPIALPPEKAVTELESAKEEISAQEESKNVMETFASSSNEEATVNEKPQPASEPNVSNPLVKTENEIPKQHINPAPEPTPQKARREKVERIMLTKSSKGGIKLIADVLFLR